MSTAHWFPAATVESGKSNRTHPLVFVIFGPVSCVLSRSTAASDIQFASPEVAEHNVKEYSVFFAYASRGMDRGSCFSRKYLRTSCTPKHFCSYALSWLDDFKCHVSEVSSERKFSLFHPSRVFFSHDDSILEKRNGFRNNVCFANNVRGLPTAPPTILQILTSIGGQLRREGYNENRVNILLSCTIEINIKVLRADQGEVRRVWSRAGLRGMGKKRFPRKLADQRHRRSRFPHASIRQRTSWEWNPVRLASVNSVRVLWHAAATHFSAAATTGNGYSSRKGRAVSLSPRNANTKRETSLRKFTAAHTGAALILRALWRHQQLEVELSFWKKPAVLQNRPRETTAVILRRCFHICSQVCGKTQLPRPQGLDSEEKVGSYRLYDLTAPILLLLSPSIIVPYMPVLCPRVRAPFPILYRDTSPERATFLLIADESIFKHSSELKPTCRPWPCESLRGRARRAEARRLSEAACRPHTTRGHACLAAIRQGDVTNSQPYTLAALLTTNIPIHSIRALATRNNIIHNVHNHNFLRLLAMCLREKTSSYLSGLIVMKYSDTERSWFADRHSRHVSSGTYSLIDCAKLWKWDVCLIGHCVQRNWRTTLHNFAVLSYQKRGLNDEAVLSLRYLPILSLLRSTKETIIPGALKIFPPELDIEGCVWLFDSRRWHTHCSDLLWSLASRGLLRTHHSRQRLRLTMSLPCFLVSSQASFRAGGGGLCYVEIPIRFRSALKCTAEFIQRCAQSYIKDRFTCPQQYEQNYFGDKMDFKRVFTEVTFAIGSEFIRHTLDDSAPIADLQENKKRIPYCQMWGNTGATANEQTSDVQLYKGVWTIGLRSVKHARSAEFQPPPWPRASVARRRACQSFASSPWARPAVRRQTDGHGNLPPPPLFRGGTPHVKVAAALPTKGACRDDESIPAYWPGPLTPSHVDAFLRSSSATSAPEVPGPTEPHTGLVGCA
ncbi:hypothetical protein PR048_017629 [Dryococelus australis]|uniref:Uncharacterized protein n=1 Tax=Dryococelus australis TaxID=614101 RepID=A0ABQ9HA81_9NEOP|nr:hypothetical protein PR048_017629 [Dryococelus australis]